MPSPLNLLRRSFASAVLPWTRREMPGWSYLAVIGGDRIDGLWKDLPPATVRGKQHGYLMRLQRADWAERQTWFTGRYYERAVQALVSHALREGDTFVDIGTNIGMITLLAASRVKQQGLVLSFEPNPGVYARLREHIELNGLDGVVRTFPVGLGNEKAELTLNIPESHSGMASMGTPRDLPQWAKRREVKVSVDRADRIIPQDTPGAMFVKIDVEGFERQVLEGLTGVLDARKPAVLMECNDEMLRHAGSTQAQIWDLMTSRGYRALEPYEAGPDAVRLSRLDTPESRREEDMLWLVPGQEHEKRLSSLIDARS
jgi:FkbM family methyltransferase